MSVYGTKIVKNLNPKADDVKWGLLFRVVAWAGGIVSTLVVAGMFWFTQRVNAAVDLIPIMNERQQQVLKHLEKIDARFEEEGDVLTQNEFRQWLDSEYRKADVRAIVSAPTRRQP